MKRFILVGLGIVFSAGAHATNGFLQHAGANAAGYTTRSIGMGVLTANPAAGQFLLREGQSLRLGLLTLPNVGYEFGPVDNFVDDVETFEKRLDQEGLTQAEAQAIIDEFQPVLAEIGEAAYVNVDAQQQLPLTPMLFRSFGGVLTVDVGTVLRTGITILDAPLELVDNGDGTFDATTDSAAYIRSGVFTKLGLGYSSAVTWGKLPEGASLTGGARLNVIQGRLGKAVAALDDSNDGESSFDRIEENYDANEKSSIGVGVDVGAIYSRGGLSFGTTIYNLLPPKFDFSDIGVDCASITDPGLRSDCETAALFAAEVKPTEAYTDETRLNVEAGYRILESNWVIGGALDLNKVEALSGREFQWASLSAGYESPNWWLPGFSIGYKKNVAGSNLSYATLGFSLFSFLTLNANYGLESAQHDGESVPRGGSASIGFEVPL